MIINLTDSFQETLAAALKVEKDKIHAVKDGETFVFRANSRLFIIPEGKAASLSEDQFLEQARAALSAVPISVT